MEDKTEKYSEDVTIINQDDRQYVLVGTAIFPRNP
jgi:hypothetical protein